MDYGEATFTSFSGDENWLKCFDTYPQVDPISPQPGWYIGKIHDHPNFAVYHSPTDKNDLYATAPNLPMFLSLIVNYATETDCQLAIAVEVEETALSRVKWKLKGWKNAQNKLEKKKVEKKITYVMLCDVSYEQDQWMIDQCDYLKDRKKEIVVDHTPTYNPTTTPKETKPATGTIKIVRKHISNKILANLSDLVTLGEGGDLPLAIALSKADSAVTVATRDKYKKAVKHYFIEYWYDGTFYNMTTSEGEVLEGVVDALRSQNGWIVTVLKEAINELKIEYPKLWAVQESPMV